MADRILQGDTRGIVYRNPGHVDVATFIGNPRINLLPARIEGGRAMVGGTLFASGLALAGGTALRLGIRP